MSDYERVYDLIMAGWASQAVRALAALSVAEHLADGPLTAFEVAERESCNAPSMYRLLRAATSLGLVVHDNADDRFTATPLLAVLDGRSPVSLKNYAQAAIGPAFWLPALGLLDSVRSGRPRVRETLGGDVFEWMAEHPAAAVQFAAAMSDLSTPVIREAVAHIDTTGVRLAVDVGGAQGALLAAVLEADPEVSGIVLELPAVVASADAEARRRGLAQRMHAVAGDFMQSIPDGDLFLLKFVLHDWDDAACHTILSHIRAAMRPGARLCIVEMAAQGANVPAALATMDMAMMFSTGGQERELGQFAALLNDSGLAMTRTVALSSPYHLIEARVP